MTIKATSNIMDLSIRPITDIVLEGGIINQENTATIDGTKIGILEENENSNSEPASTGKFTNFIIQYPRDMRFTDVNGKTLEEYIQDESSPPKLFSSAKKISRRGGIWYANSTKNPIMICFIVGNRNAYYYIRRNSNSPRILVGRISEYKFFSTFITFIVPPNYQFMCTSNTILTVLHDGTYN